MKSKAGFIRVIEEGDGEEKSSNSSRESLHLSKARDSQGILSVKV